VLERDLHTKYVTKDEISTLKAKVSS